MQYGSHHGNKCVTQLVDGAVNVMLGAVGAPMIPDVIGEGWRPVFLWEKVRGFNSTRNKHLLLGKDDLFCVVGEVNLALGVFGLAGCDLAQLVD